MQFIFKLGVIIILMTSCQTKPTNKSIADSFEIGIIADCQYCNCETSGSRFYTNSPNKLRAAVQELNKKDLEYTVHLGDFIDREFSSYNDILPIWNTLNSGKHHVLGNHDFSVADSLKSKVLRKLDLKERYYSFTINQWRFIVLDGNDLSFHGSISEEKKQQTDSIYNLLLKDSLSYLQKWNGALSNKQFVWIKSELEIATKNNENVGFYCHFPVYPLDPHNLWNRNDLIKLIDRYDCVKLYLNGHNHAGAYEMVNGVHYLTFQGMVETNVNSSFATAKFTEDSVMIKGYGREISRRLKLK